MARPDIQGLLYESRLSHSSYTHVAPRFAESNNVGPPVRDFCFGAPRPGPYYHPDILCTATV